MSVNGSSMEPAISFLAGIFQGVSLGIFATLLSGVIVYLFRQHWERKKLKKALKTELEHMSGLEECADSLDRASLPLNEDEIPPGDSISTAVYDGNAARLGLLKSDELTDVVEFYSELVRYKGIMNSLRDGDVPEADESDLHDSIGEVEEKRKDLIDNL